MAGSSRGVKRAPGGRAREAVEAERAPVAALAVPRHEVPAAADVDERVRLDLAAAGDAVAAGVAEAHALVVAAGRRDHGQRLRVDGRPAAGRHRHGRRLQRLHAPAQVRGQHLLELDERAHGGLLDAGDRCARGRAQADGDRDRLLVVEQQRRHRGAGRQAVAAGGTGQRLDRVAEPTQPLDVAPHRPPRHLEAVGELPARPVAAALQQGQQRQQAARRGRVAHVSIVSDIEDRYWPKSVVGSTDAFIRSSR